TTRRARCPWPMPAPAPTAASSSSPTGQRRGWMTSTASSAPWWRQTTSRSWMPSAKVIASTKSRSKAPSTTCSRCNANAWPNGTRCWTRSAEAAAVERPTCRRRHEGERMSAFLLLFGCLVLGALVAHCGKPPANMARGLNWWVLNIALPALVLQMIPQLEFDPELWYAVAVLWLTFIGAWLVFGTLGPLLGWSRARTGCVILVTALGNT